MVSTQTPADYAQNRFGYDESFSNTASGNDEINCEGINALSIHLRLSAGATTTVTVTVLGTNDPAAVAASDTNWVDLSTAILGAANKTVTNATLEDIFFTSTKLPLRRLKLKTVVTGSTSPSMKAYIRKSM